MKKTTIKSNNSPYITKAEFDKAKSEFINTFVKEFIRSFSENFYNELYAALQESIFCAVSHCVDLAATDGVSMSKPVFAGLANASKVELNNDPAQDIYKAAEALNKEIERLSKSEADNDLAPAKPDSKSANDLTSISQSFTKPDKYKRGYCDTPLGRELTPFETETLAQADITIDDINAAISALLAGDDSYVLYLYYKIYDKENYNRLTEFQAGAITNLVHNLVEDTQAVYQSANQIADSQAASKVDPKSTGKQSEKKEKQNYSCDTDLMDIITDALFCFG